MEKMKLFEKSFTNEKNAVYQLEYFLKIRSAEMGKTYGVMIRKIGADSVVEEDCVDGLCESREEAEHFLFRLAEGLALPMELTALCDDYISEREFEKKSETGMTAC